MDEEYDQFNGMDVNNELLRNSEFGNSEANLRGTIGSYAGGQK